MNRRNFLQGITAVPVIGIVPYLPEPETQYERWVRKLGAELDFYPIITDLEPFNNGVIDKNIGVSCTIYLNGNGVHRIDQFYTCHLPISLEGKTGYVTILLNHVRDYLCKQVGIPREICADSLEYARKIVKDLGIR